MNKNILKASLIHPCTTEKVNTPNNLVESPYRRSFVTLALFFLSLTVVSGCDTPGNFPSTPSDIVKSYFSALIKGDQKTLKEIKLDGEGVAPIAVGVARNLGPQRGKLTCSHVIKGDTAVVKATFENGEIINVVLKNVNEKWKIDRMANEQLIPGNSFIPENFRTEYNKEHEIKQ